MRRVSQAWCRPHPELTSLQHQACAILPSSPKVLAPFTLQFHLEHARAENPANPPLIGANILCSLPRTFNLAQESIQAYGKSLLIEIPRQALSVGVTFLQIQFYLPRHMLVIAETELLEIEHYWSQWSDKLRSRVHPHISLCIRLCSGEPSLIFLDHNKSLRYLAIHHFFPLSMWKPSACGPDPILAWTAFCNGILSHRTRSAMPIFLYIRSSPAADNTIHQSKRVLRSRCINNHRGTAYADSQIHPLTQANLMFSSPELQEVRRRIVLQRLSGSSWTG